MSTQHDFHNLAGCPTTVFNSFTSGKPEVDRTVKAMISSIDSPCANKMEIFCPETNDEIEIRYAPDGSLFELSARNNDNGHLVQFYQPDGGCQDRKGIYVAEYQPHKFYPEGLIKEHLSLEEDNP